MLERHTPGSNCVPSCLLQIRSVDQRHYTTVYCGISEWMLQNRGRFLTIGGKIDGKKRIKVKSLIFKSFASAETGWFVSG